jgi:hypothetical protein
MARRKAADKRKANVAARKATLQLPTHCIFCEAVFEPGNPRTGEHIWPEWMHEQLPDTIGWEYSAVVGHTPDVPSRWTPMSGMPKRRIKPKVVCQRCNNGWMSRLETAVRPILEPLVKGHARTLSPQDQTKLATWLFVKNIVMEYSDEQTRVTPDADVTLSFRTNCRRPTWACGLAGSSDTHGEPGTCATRWERRRSNRDSIHS